MWIINEQFKNYGIFENTVKANYIKFDGTVCANNE